MKTAQEIMDIINSVPNQDLCFGIRTTTEIYDIGEQAEVSRRWDDGKPTEDELNGTCAIGIEHVGGESWPCDSEAVKLASIEKAIKLSSIYEGNHKYLIAGESAELGEDNGEWVISVYDSNLLAWSGAIVIACLD